MSLDLLNKIKCGAIVLFQGLSSVSYVVEGLTSSTYSHCGIIMDPTDKRGVKFSHALGKGITVSYLDDLIHKKECDKIVVLNLLNDVNPEQLIQTCDQYIGLPYDFSIFDLLSAVKGKEVIMSDPKNMNKFFCSKYVAQVLIDLEIIKDKKPSIDYSPDHLSKLGEIYDLKNPIEIQIDKPSRWDKFFDFLDSQ